MLPRLELASSINNMGRIRYDKKAESEFFVDNSALAGFTGERILYMAVRELIENSLDSCEIHHILPDITLSLKLVDPLNDLWLISCEDNGIGIPMTKCCCGGVLISYIREICRKTTERSFWRRSQDDSCVLNKGYGSSLECGVNQVKIEPNITLISEQISIPTSQLSWPKMH